MKARPKLYVAIPAYKAALTLPSVFERFPAEIVDWAEEFVVVDDGSPDNQVEVLREIRQRQPKLKLLRHPKNRGYGGACKTGLGYCREHGADLVAWVHADGQYAPEMLPTLLAPLADGRADMVQGSRMKGSGALAGGMPVYKFVANKLLSLTENVVFGMHLAEFHSGYMVYHRRALEAIPFEAFADNFIFDQEMMIVGHRMGLRLLEIGIPTRYADEVSNLRPIPYGFAVLGMIGDFLLGRYEPRQLRLAARAARAAGAGSYQVDGAAT